MTVNVKHPSGTKHEDCNTCSDGSSSLCMCCNPTLADLPICWTKVTDEHVAFTQALFALFEKAECYGDLMWHVTNDGIVFSVNVSDVFDWGSADCEPILLDDIPALLKAYEDLKEIGEEYYLPELYTARKRKMRPQGAAYPLSKGAGKLLDEAGPERDTGLGNPYTKAKLGPQAATIVKVLRQHYRPEHKELYDALAAEGIEIAE